MTSITATTQPIRIQRPEKKEESSMTRESSSGDLILSQSLGVYAPGAGRMLRHMSDVSNISHAGYLLKRSNRPIHRTLSPFPPPSEEYAYTPPPSIRHRAAALYDYGNSTMNREERKNNSNHDREDQSVEYEQHEESPMTMVGSSHYPQHLDSNSLPAEPCTGAPQDRITTATAAAVDVEKQQQQNHDNTSDSTFKQSMEFAAAFLGIDSGLLFSSEGAQSTANTPPPAPRPLTSRSQPIQMQKQPQSRQESQSQISRSQSSSSDYEKHDSFHATRRSSEPLAVIKKESTLSNSNHSNPPDIVSTDGHVWRAKYCVLENGILYFYRHQMDAEAPEAHSERQQQLQITLEQAAAAAAADADTSSPILRTSLALSPIPSRAMLDVMAGTPSSQSPYATNTTTGYTWEKFVALNSVGAVRSAELEYGPNSFELIDNEDPEESLILRARNSDEMNEWIFQFHRSIASYVLDMMECASSFGSDTKQLSDRSCASNNANTAFQPASFQRKGVPMTCFDLSPADRNLMTFSPWYPKHAFATPSLSHGHGRNQLHRRRLELTQSNSSDICIARSFQEPPAFPLLPNQQQSLMPQSHVDVLMTPPRALRFGAEPPSTSEPEVVAPQSDYPETERPPPPKPGKYVPPHLRAGTPAPVATTSKPPPPPAAATAAAGSSKKYVPPHLRKTAKYVPPHLRNNRNDYYSTPCRQPPPVDIDVIPQDVGLAVYTASEPSNDVAMAFDEPELIEDEQCCIGFKLGGCADPSLVAGSILDPMYIPRKASRLGKVQADPFGCLSSADDRDSILRWEIGAFSECGVRDSNEDSYLIASDLFKAFTAHGMETSSTVWEHDEPSHAPSLYAVFDGHCGDHGARFAAERLISCIHQQSYLGSATTSSGTDRIEDVLRRAIAQLDHEFCNICVDGGREWESGATALVAALVDEQLIIANLGDCRGIICRSVNSRQDDEMDDGWNELPSTDYSGSRRCLWKEVTEIHSPSREDERVRIEKANGWITTEKEIPVGQLQRMVLFDQDVVDILKRCFADRIEASNRAAAPQRILQISRVCGELAVSRALGDRDFKAAHNVPATTYQWNDDGEREWTNESLFLPYPDDHSRTFSGDLVSNSPDFQSLRVGEPGVSDEFLLLGCDGLWDVMDADDAVRVTRDLLFEKGWPAKRAASRLAELAVHLGSSDNITVIVIRFFERQCC